MMRRRSVLSVDVGNCIVLCETGESDVSVLIEQGGEICPRGDLQCLSLALLRVGDLQCYILAGIEGIHNGLIEAEPLDGIDLDNCIRSSVFDLL